MLKLAYPNTLLSIHTGVAAALGAERIYFALYLIKECLDQMLLLRSQLMKQNKWGRRDLSTTNHPIDKTDNSPYLGLKKIFGKTLAVITDLPKGHQLTFDDLEAKKPANYGHGSIKVLNRDYGKHWNKEKRKYDLFHRRRY